MVNLFLYFFSPSLGIKSKMRRFTDKESYLIFYFWALVHKMSLEHIAEQNTIQEIDYCAPWPPFLLLCFSEVPCLSSSRARFVLSLLHLPPPFTVLKTVSTCSRTSAVLASPLTLPWRWRVDKDPLISHTGTCCPCCWLTPISFPKWKHSVKGKGKDSLSCVLLLFWVMSQGLLRTCLFWQGPQLDSCKEAVVPGLRENGRRCKQEPWGFSDKHHLHNWATSQSETSVNGSVILSNCR